MALVTCGICKGRIKYPVSREKLVIRRCKPSSSCRVLYCAVLLATNSAVFVHNYGASVGKLTFVAVTVACLVQGAKWRLINHTWMAEFSFEYWHRNDIRDGVVSNY